mmetsp:Transcript_57544/g.129729  ORF Transcript_57544/g.129729 Transcript_57544/m.129729 type:complete len:248 (+) Transcript_57544:802-1545(+)
MWFLKPAVRVTLVPSLHRGSQLGPQWEAIRKYGSQVSDAACCSSVPSSAPSVPSCPAAFIPMNRNASVADCSRLCTCFPSCSNAVMFFSLWSSAFLYSAAAACSGLKSSVCLRNAYIFRAAIKSSSWTYSSSRQTSVAFRQCFTCSSSTSGDIELRASGACCLIAVSSIDMASVWLGMSLPPFRAALISVSTTSRSDSSFAARGPNGSSIGATFPLESSPCRCCSAASAMNFSIASFVPCIASSEGG